MTALQRAPAVALTETTGHRCKTAHYATSVSTLFFRLQNKSTLSQNRKPDTFCLRQTKNMEQKQQH